MEYACNDPGISLFLLVDDSSRFARRRAVAVAVKELLARHGVQVVTVSEPWADPRTAIGVWMEGFKEIKAEAVSLEIRYHVMKCMTQNAAQRDPETGWCYKNGGRAPIGYRNVRVPKGRSRKGKDVVKLLWEVDEEWAPVVRRIALETWARGGLSFKQIRDKLNGEGLVNPAGQPWHISTIREICYRALDGQYNGIYYWNRTARKVKVVGQKWNRPEEWVVVENAHPAIISPEEWQALREQTADRRGSRPDAKAN